MSSNVIEIQHQVRENSMKLQAEYKNIKDFEMEMKFKELNMSKTIDSAKENLKSNSIPIRSSADFEKFHKEMNTTSNEDNQDKDKSKTNPKIDADSYKEKGNAFVKAKDYESAIKMYTVAIEMRGNEAVYYSNRSQCFLSLEKYEECIQDTKKAIELDEKSSKAYYRQMTAYEKMGKNLEALKSCQSWMEELPNDQLSKTNYDRIHNKIIEERSLRKRAHIKWSKYPDQTNFVEKKPHLQSKSPLKSLPVSMKKSYSPIPDTIIDKIFNNNTGEHLSEPETDSKLFKANFLDEKYCKPKAIKPTCEANVVAIDNKAIVNKQNEIVKAKESKTAEETCNKDKCTETLEELESLKKSLLVLPKTGTQFYAAWKEFNDDLKFLYLRDIAKSSSNFGSLLGAQLDSDLLSEIIQIIHKYLKSFNTSIIQMIYDLSQNSEISVLKMFIDEMDKKKLIEILDSEVNDGKDNNNMIQQLKENLSI